MKFLTFLFALVALYALVQAKGLDVSQRKESPLRKALTRTVTSAPVEPVEPAEEVRSVSNDAEEPASTLVEEEPVVLSQEKVQDEPVEVVRPVPSRAAPRPAPTLVQEQPQEEQPVEVPRWRGSKTAQRPVQPTQVQEQPQEEQPVELPRKRPAKTVARRPVVQTNQVQEEQPVVEVVKKAPNRFVQRKQVVQQPVQQQQPVKQPRKVVSKSVSRPVQTVVQERAQEEQPVEQPRPVQRQPVARWTPVRKTVQREQPVLVQDVQDVQDVQPVQQPRPAQRQYNVRATLAPVVTRPNVEIIRPSAPVEPVQPVEEPKAVVFEQVEQGQDDTDEDSHSVQLQEPAPLRRFVSAPAKKLEAPQQNKRRFNVLLRTADGFNEKAGYSVHSRSVLAN